MDRINRICAHPLWRESAARIAELERTRVFCRHNVTHFMDVARLAHIENLERGLSLAKEEIYAAALLHDIGRHLQYEQGIPHDQGSAEIAGQILRDCGFADGEMDRILGAITGHRTPQTGKRDDLAGVLYRADKQSRMCLFCDAQRECDWSEEKKNLRIKS